MARILLVRHGQASFGAVNYDCLSDTGAEQARHLGKVLRERGEHIDALWCGTLQRHQQTVTELLRGADWTLEQRNLSSLDEFDHQQVIARYEPRYCDQQTMRRELAAAANPREAFAQMFSAALARWNSGTADGEYDEPWFRFQARCESALEQMQGQLGSDETHLVVTSGGVIATITQALLGLDGAAAIQVNWTLVNAGITTLHVNRRGKRRLLSLNEHSHFRGDHQHLLTWL